VHGGAGKSAIALYLGACIALPARWCGLDAVRRRVYYVSCEDGRDILHWRLARISRHLGIALEDLAAWLYVIDAIGIDPELMIEAGRGEEPMMTALYSALADRVQPGSVIIIDGASDTYGASEIVRRHVRRFVRALRRLAGEHGAVLLLAHVDKAAARKSESGDRYSGSTAWHNSVRARWELAADGDELVLALAKANHARAGAEIRLRWDESAHMHVPVDAAADGGIVASIRERTEREAILAAIRGCAGADPPVLVPAALTGPRTTWHVLSERQEFPAALRAGDRATRARFARHVELLRQSGAIEEQSVRTDARHRVRVLLVSAVRES
jgi:RecA-family ATPase